ncbi:DUF262 domain-containing protein [Pseudomonas mosselii]|uniref:DUF262 domain-containing protein n=1 Tax=Pseudomonas mosselii TaxID=78327 RepID=UPI0018D601F9|nr:DUF262 domain-containing protein [Pseudomonas mosselii]MBH3311384.1 DUF262 domain-containing protein [Pseudomonas mosselii]MBH3326970.1 DUF262 domain-containing protein [Pseudomonas mosselii]
MKINAKDPDIATLYHRIKRGTIDLRPDFQRDMVWSKAKKQGLIDTILRDWKFPPVFLVITSLESLEVLDGQQRLSSIVDFLEDQFPIDGNIEPLDEEISALHGKYYKDLPEYIKLRIEQYSLRVHELYDFKEGEPYELFFRLNQGVTLTPAEKRNTFFGPVREQIKGLVAHMERCGVNGSLIGFNNNRLSYDDVVARLVYAVYTRNIHKKITDINLIDFYRAGEEVPHHIEEQVAIAINTLVKACVVGLQFGSKTKLNKPTLLTWLIHFYYEHTEDNIPHLFVFESIREHTKESNEEASTASLLFTIYNERSASSVNDAVPVKLRLLIIYLIGLMEGQRYSSSIGERARAILSRIESADNVTEAMLITFMDEERWGLE